MSWADAKTQLATVLATVAITSPIVQTIKRVYSDPPGTIADLPCLIIFPPAVIIERNYGHRDKSYIVRCQLFVTDADLDRAAALVDAYREAMIDVMDDNTELNGTSESAMLDRIEEAKALEYGGRNCTGFSAFITVRLHDNKTFGS